MTLMHVLLSAISILLSLCILVQHRTSGLSQTFGGSGAVVVQRRGAERVIYVMSVVLSIAFFALALLMLPVMA